MDFLTLFGIYVAVVLTCMFLVCKYSGQQHNPFNTLVAYVTKVGVFFTLLLPPTTTGWRFMQVPPSPLQVAAPFTPEWLQRFSHWIFHRLFHQRLVVKLCLFSALSL